MAIKALKCPNCGGVIELFDETMKKGFCPFCDSLILDVQEKQNQFVTIMGKIQVDGISSIDNLLTRSSNYFEDGEFGKAEEYVNRALDVDANNSNAQSLYAKIRKAMIPDLLKKSREALSRHENNTVEEICKKILKIDSENEEVKQILLDIRPIMINKKEYSLSDFTLIISALENGSKVSAIRNCRELTGLGLVQSKYLVDELEKLDTLNTRNIIGAIEKVSRYLK